MKNQLTKQHLPLSKWPKEIYYRILGAVPKKPAYDPDGALPYKYIAWWGNRFVFGYTRWQTFRMLLRK